MFKEVDYNSRPLTNLRDARFNTWGSSKHAAGVLACSAHPLLFGHVKTGVDVKKELAKMIVEVMRRDSVHV